MPQAVSPGTVQCVSNAPVAYRTYRSECVETHPKAVVSFVLDPGVKKGDRVSIYLPMIPELVYTMLACARIGAVHSIVVSGLMKRACHSFHRIRFIKIHLAKSQSDPGLLLH